MAGRERAGPELAGGLEMTRRLGDELSTRDCARSEGKSYSMRRESEDIPQERKCIARYDRSFLEMDNAPRAQLRATLFCSAIRALLRSPTNCPSTNVALRPPSGIVCSIRCGQPALFSRSFMVMPCWFEALASSAFVCSMVRTEVEVTWRLPGLLQAGWSFSNADICLI
jgi:hypothetical protein